MYETINFLAWLEERNEAVVISPPMPRGTELATSATITDLLHWMA